MSHAHGRSTTAQGSRRSESGLVGAAGERARFGDQNAAAVAAVRTSASGGRSRTGRTHAGTQATVPSAPEQRRRGTRHDAASVECVCVCATRDSDSDGCDNEHDNERDHDDHNNERDNERDNDKRDRDRDRDNSDSDCAAQTPRHRSADSTDVASDGWWR